MIIIFVLDSHQVIIGNSLCENDFKYTDFEGNQQQYIKFNNYTIYQCSPWTYVYTIIVDFSIAVMLLFSFFVIHYYQMNYHDSMDQTQLLIHDKNYQGNDLKPDYENIDKDNNIADDLNHSNEIYMATSSKNQFTPNAFDD